MGAQRPANRLRELREAAGLTQEQIATALGFTQPTVQRHESGNRGLDGWTIERYARFHGVSPYELFIAQASPPPAPPAATSGEEAAVLEQERRFYQENLASWLSRYPGKFVLVKGRELIAVCDTIEDALAEGARRFGLDSYLVRRVQAAPPEVSMPALSLGLLSADSTRSADE